MSTLQLMSWPFSWETNRNEFWPPTTGFKQKGLHAHLPHKDKLHIIATNNNACNAPMRNFCPKPCWLVDEPYS